MASPCEYRANAAQQREAAAATSFPLENRGCSMRPNAGTSWPTRSSVSRCVRAAATRCITEAALVYLWGEAPGSNSL